MSVLKNILIMALLFIIINTVHVFGVVGLSGGITESITTAVREYVVRNNLIKVGLLFKQFEKGKIIGIYLKKNDVVLVGDYVEDSLFVKKISNNIYIDEYGKVKLAEVVFCFDLTAVTQVSVALSLLITIAFHFIQKYQKKIDDANIIEKLENEKMYALSRQAEEFAHDVKSPIIGLELILEELKKTGGQAGLIANARTYLNQVKQISDSILKKDNLEKTIDLIMLSDEIGKIITSKEVEKGVKINLTVEPDIWILANRNMFKRIMSNLLNNAFESEWTSMVCVSVKKVNDNVVILIKDNGKGFDSSVLKNFGGRPISTKKNGHGIGLSSASKSIVAWGGEMFIDNVRDGGAIVTILFKNYINYKIVLIDDDELVRVLWENEIKKITKNYEIYSDINEDIIEKISHKNTLLYLDSNINNKRGESFIKIIKEKSTMDIKVFMQTGYASEKYANFDDITSVIDKKPNWIDN